MDVLSLLPPSAAALFRDDVLFLALVGGESNKLLLLSKSSLRAERNEEA
jgi:hypothetical protein